MQSKICTYCNIVFFKQDKDSQWCWNNRRKFCSVACQIKSRTGKTNPLFSGSNNPKWKGGQVEKSCLTCKEKFTVDPYRKDTAKYCSFKCKGIDKKGISVSPETQFKKGFKTPSPFGKDGKNVGENHWNWQGGKTKELKRLRGTAQYISWRKAVFERDDYTCLFCGIRGATLNADHILPFAFFPELRFDISNGRTLCEECHRTTDTFATKALQFKLISQ
jgi:5-methylcytosine-specific restriction endonuclease McrA